MQSFRDSKNSFGVCLLLLVSLSGCSGELSFEITQKPVDQRDDDRRGDDNDAPIHLPGMVTASQFLMGCRARPAMVYGPSLHSRLECKVRGPDNLMIESSQEWLVAGPDGEMTFVTQPVPGKPAMTSLLFPEIFGFPMNISTTLLLADIAEPLKVTQRYAKVEDVLPNPAAHPDCKNFYRHLQTYSKLNSGPNVGFAIEYIQTCYEGYMNTYLACTEGLPHAKPFGCWH